MKTRTKYLIPLSIVAVLVAIMVYRILSGRAATDSRRQSAPLVKVEPARRETVTYALRFTGDVTPVQQASFFSKVSGNLKRVYAEP
jgi:multidrug efflux pump subunit AcrA (membrane-fusion protein)